MSRVRCAISAWLSSLIVVALLGCAAPQTERILHAEFERREAVELAEVPFFPQEQYYCGPASFAMLLAWNGMAVTPNDVVAEVYTPGRAGTFAADIVAAARRRGLLAVQVGDLNGLLREVKAGRPVLVMQNLALPWFPRWHFAVAVGYDLEGPQLILRSGTNRRLVTPLDAFERTWERAERFGIVILPPDAVPANLDKTAWLNAIAGLERAGAPQAALTGYRTFLKAFPDERIAQMGEANALLGVKDYAAAEASYRRVLTQNPDMAEAWNNLAYALHFQGKRDEAIASARRAVEIAGATDANYAETLRELSAPPRRRKTRARPAT